MRFESWPRKGRGERRNDRGRIGLFLPSFLSEPRKRERVQSAGRSVKGEARNISSLISARPFRLSFVSLSRPFIPLLLVCVNLKSHTGEMQIRARPSFTPFSRVRFLSSPPRFSRREKCRPPDSIRGSKKFPPSFERPEAWQKELDNRN